ncbi:hypothetical protein L5515_002566 [Caenorhabditis briggsae]|uniref:C-type lectin domain-containing protein n=1 Tax=Caenorhabditis briggsae TaxID=6238 RepID=A0AAE9E8D9_CAEBR|nr:hypothetical protein L5515_002566 [Caenorhabditis briggsae]
MVQKLNCFCPSSNWYQYRTPGQSYGTCIQPVGMSAVWFAALASCQLRWNISYLASEFTLDKHQFVVEIVKRTPQIREPYAYHIGLRRIDGEWYWDQPTGLLPVRDYKNWGYDYPSQSKKLSVGMNFENSGKWMEWKNVDPRFPSNYVSNCFCPNDWIQYRQFYSDTNSYRYGVCFQPVTLTAVWKAAKMSCANRWNNSYLVNEFNLSKHNFILDIVNATVGFHQPFSYHIGGNKVGGVWKWDRPTGWEQPELKKWYNWEDGYPIASSTLNAILNQQTGPTKWENIDMLKTAANYVCETASCDTDNYCSSDGRLDE